MRSACRKEQGQLMSKEKREGAQGLPRSSRLQLIHHDCPSNGSWFSK